MNKTRQRWHKIWLILLIAPVILLVGFSPGAQAQEKSVDANGPVVSLDYKEANLSTVLRAISYAYDLNLVVTKDVKGTVTVSLKNVPIDEALEAILSVNGYAFTRKGNIVYITQGPGLEGIDIATQPLRLRYLSAGEAQRLLNKVLTSRGSMEVNEATNSLVVTDYPGTIEKLRKLLDEIDTPPMQVLIEAKIIDVEAKAFENFGT